MQLNRRFLSTHFDTHKFITGLCLNGFSEEQGQKLSVLLNTLFSSATTSKQVLVSDQTKEGNDLDAQNNGPNTQNNDLDAQNNDLDAQNKSLCAGHSVAIPSLQYSQQLHATRIRLMELKAALESQHRNDLLEERLATDRIGREITAMLQKSRDSAGTIRGEASLELGIERGRLRDGLGKARIRFHELKNGIDVEASNAQASLVKLRNDIFYSLIGFFFTSAAAFLGYLRYCN